MPAALAIQVKLNSLCRNVLPAQGGFVYQIPFGILPLKEEKPLLRILRATRAFPPRIYYYSFEPPFYLKYL